MQLWFRSVICKNKFFSLKIHCHVTDRETSILLTVSMKIIPHVLVTDCIRWTLLSGNCV